MRTKSAREEAFVDTLSMNTAVVVACLNDFCKNIKKKTVVVMDNSSIHRSEEFEEYMALWKKKGLII